MKYLNLKLYCSLVIFLDSCYSIWPQTVSDCPRLSQHVSVCNMYYQRLSQTAHFVLHNCPTGCNDWLKDHSYTQDLWSHALLVSKLLLPVDRCFHDAFSGWAPTFPIQITIIIRPIVNLWLNHTSWGKYAIPQDEVNSDKSIYASWGKNWPIRVYLTLRYDIYSPWGMIMPRVYNGPIEHICKDA